MPSALVKSGEVADSSVHTSTKPEGSQSKVDDIRWTGSIIQVQGKRKHFGALRMDNKTFK